MLLPKWRRHGSEFNLGTNVQQQKQEPAVEIRRTDNNQSCPFPPEGVGGRNG